MASDEELQQFDVLPLRRKSRHTPTTPSWFRYTPLMHVETYAQHGLAFTSIVLNQDGQWEFTWVDDGADEWRVVLNGTEIATVSDDDGPTYTYDLPGFEDFPPPLEVVDDGDLALSEYNPPFIIMQWYSVQDGEVTFYEVQEYVSGDWNQVYIISHDAGTWVFQTTSPVLDDVTIFRFQVVAVGTIEQESSGLEFTAKMVRCPILTETALTIGYDDDTLSILVQEVA